MVIEEAVVQVRLIWYRGRDTMHRGRRYEVAPIAEVVDAVLRIGIRSRKVLVGKEGIGIREEVCNGLGFAFGQQRVAGIII